MDPKSTTFVKENMELFVLDNSIDAVLNNPDPVDEPTIRVSLVSSKQPNEFTLSTVDNGSL